MSALESTQDFSSLPIACEDIARRVASLARARAPMLLVGPPGIGKAMIARRIPGLLDLTDATRALIGAECAACGIFGVEPGPHAPGYRPIVVSEFWAGDPPFRAPHHTVSAGAMLGTTRAAHRITCRESTDPYTETIARALRTPPPHRCNCDRGDRVYRPGELHLARGGVLYLDELPEFARATVRDAAAAWHAMPRETRPILVAGANGCPCGWYGHTLRECVCTEGARARYSERLDLSLAALGITERIQIPPLDVRDMRDARRCPSTSDLRKATL